MIFSEAHMEDHSDEAKIEAFQAQQEVMRQIKENGFADYAETLPNLADAFDLSKAKVEDHSACLCCMDERTGQGVHMAGSGILLSGEDFTEAFKKSGADAISSHDGCGAAKIYAEKMGLVGNSDQIGREWAEARAKELGVPHVHLEVEKPFHFARVCYYDSTGKFNYAGDEGLPAGFVVGRSHMSEKSSLAECEVAKSIAFGDHGFGKNLLNKDSPFIFVAIAVTKEEVEKFKKELAEFAGEDVLVDGFVMPEAEKSKKEEAA